MSIILGIDPGTKQSGWVLYEKKRHLVLESGITENQEIVNELRQPCHKFMVEGFQYCACEWIESFGMAVGKTTFETVFWIGRFFECKPHERITRREVKLHLCNSTRAKDANIRQAILDKFPASGGGKTPQVGTKKEPGPLYGVSSHEWSALAVALTFAETKLKGATNQ